MNLNSIQINHPLCIYSQPVPLPSRSRPYMSDPMTWIGPATYAGPLPLPPAQSTSLAIGMHPE
jgi:hypothetical protein